MIELPTNFVHNGEVLTACQEIGNGEAFVLVHGFTGSKLDFQDQLAWFCDARRVIAYDQRGHGESTNLGRAEAYTIEHLTGDLDGFLDALGLERIDLLGHSMGGRVAMEFALAHPERVRSLVLMDTTPSPLRLFGAEVREALEERVRCHGCVSLLDGMHNRTPTPEQQRGLEFLGTEEHWRRIETKLEQMDPEAFVGIGAALGAGRDLTEALAGIRCPVTIVVGAADEPFVGPSEGMAEAIEGARLDVIPDAGHSPQYENAEAWCQSIVAHLARVS